MRRERLTLGIWFRSCVSHAWRGFLGGTPTPDTSGVSYPPSPQGRRTLPTTDAIDTPRGIPTHPSPPLTSGVAYPPTHPHPCLRGWHTHPPIPTPDVWGDIPTHPPPPLTSGIPWLGYPTRPPLTPVGGTHTPRRPGFLCQMNSVPPPPPKVLHRQTRDLHGRVHTRCGSCEIISTFRDLRSRKELYA